MESNSPVKEGDILAGKYRIERVLGVGGMGVVVAAHHIALDQHVAIKFLLPDAMAVPDVVARFGREARAAAKIQSEHVARVIDVGTLETGSPYMVMEYLEGKDLSAVLDETGPLPVEKAVTYVLQACEAIAAAHALGIVHRDLKPANLFLAKRQDRHPIVKVLDFGISKTREKEGDAQITKTSAMMGSPMYMSPEQMKATKSVDVRTDIWALGVILYELVTNDRPFGGETIAEVIGNVLSEPARPITELRPDVPAEYARIVHKCLEKKPADRFATVAEFAEALAAFAPVTQRMSIERIHRVLGTQMNIVMPPMEMVAQVPTLAGPGPAAAQPSHTQPLAQGAAPRTLPDGGASELGTQRSEGIAQTGASAGAATGAAWTNTQATAAKPFWQKPSVAATGIIVVMAAAGVAAIMAIGNKHAPGAAANAPAATTDPVAVTAAVTTASQAALPPAATGTSQAAVDPTSTAPAASTAASTLPGKVVPGAKPSGTAAATTTATAATTAATTTATAATAATTTATQAPTAAPTNTNPLKIDIIH